MSDHTDIITRVLRQVFEEQMPEIQKRVAEAIAEKEKASAKETSKKETSKKETSKKEKEESKKEKASDNLTLEPHESGFSTIAKVGGKKVKLSATFLLYKGAVVAEWKDGKMKGLVVDQIKEVQSHKIPVYHIDVLRSEKLKIDDIRELAKKALAEKVDEKKADEPAKKVDEKEKVEYKSGNRKGAWVGILASWVVDGKKVPKKDRPEYTYIGDAVVGFHDGKKVRNLSAAEMKALTSNGIKLYFKDILKQTKRVSQQEIADAIKKANADAEKKDDESDEEEEKKDEEEEKKDDEKKEPVDVFDFEEHKYIYDVMSKHFSGVTLYLRTSNLIDYLYNYNFTDKDRAAFLGTLKDQTVKQLTNLTDAFVVADMVKMWYVHFEPSRATDENVDAVVKRYQFGHNVLFNRLYKKYVAKDTNQYAELWFEKCERPILNDPQFDEEEDKKDSDDEEEDKKDSDDEEEEKKAPQKKQEKTPSKKDSDDEGAEDGDEEEKPSDDADKARKAVNSGIFPVTLEQFIKYARAVRDTRVNTADVRAMIKATGLKEETIVYIMEHVDEVKKRYPQIPLKQEQARRKLRK